MTFTVSDVAKMLYVGEETVRRWIRDGKLSARRGVGRGGNTIDCADLVEFVNQPPRAYLASMVEWLDKSGIKYTKKEVFDTDDSADLHANVLTGATATAIAGVASAMGPLGIGAAALMGAGAALTGKGIYAGAQRRSHCDFVIELNDVVEIPQVASDEAAVAPLTAEHTVAVVQECDGAAEDGNEATAESTVDKKRNDILRSLREEQINLVKYKQELARINAQITICENQIEYYKLLIEDLE